MKRALTIRTWLPAILLTLLGAGWWFVRSFFVLNGDIFGMRMTEVLHEMIAALPEGYRTVFRLYCIDELSHKEIAALLGIKEKSSSASLARARASLARSIRQYLDGESSISEKGELLK